MPEYSAGTASVRITPNADGFIRDLRTKLTTMRDPGFTVKVDAELSPAQRETERWRVEEERNQVDVPVDAETGRASAEMAEWRRMQEARPVNVRVTVDHQGAANNLSVLQKQLESFRRSDLLRLNVGALGTAAFQPAIAGLAQVAAGLQNVAQAGLVVPGAIAGAAASIGTLVLGLSGIKAAWDAAETASLSSGRTQAEAARAAASASTQLRNSNVDLGQAYKDVARATKDAQQALQDLRIEQRGGMIDESRAILEAQKAREDLASGNYTDIREQVLRIAEADQTLIETRSRNAQTAEKLNDANAKGIAGSDQVVSANERLIRSQQQVADAQLAAADAASKTSAAQDKANQLMEHLAPNGQQFLQTLINMKPAFTELRDAAQQPLFEGKAEEFEKFFNSIAPNIKNGIGTIAQGWNQNISALFGAIDSDQGKGLIDRILGNTGEAQSRLSKAIDPLVTGIGTLTAAGTDALPRLADGLTGVLTRFSDFITEADQDGRLDRWINQGIDGLANLGNTVINIGKMFTGITQAAGGGGSFLRWLEDATGRLQTFLNSAEGQQKLAKYFAEGKQLLGEFIDAAKQLPGMFQAISDGANKYLGGILPIIREVAQFLGDHPQLVSTAVAAWLAWKTINPIMTGVTNGIGFIGTSLTNLGTGFASTRQKADDEMTRTAKAFEKAGGPAGLGKFSGALSAFAGVGGPLVALVGAAGIPALMGALDKLNQKHSEAAAAAKQLDDAEKALETTLDRVTGKITAATKDQAIATAQTYNPSGPGSGVPGISSGNAIAAATSLGIPPDVYADALIGKPDAVNKVRDIILKNNIRPEFQANPELSKTLADIRGASKNALTDEDIFSALTGDFGATSKYEQALSAQGIESRSGQYSLLSIAQRLSPTGQASVLSGGALNRALAGLPGSANTSQANQAQFGQFRLTPSGTGFFGSDARVNATGPAGDPNTEFKISTNTSPAPPGLLASLQASQIPFITNPDGTITATVPGTSPYIEKYKQGSRGPTPGGRNQGFLAELHGQEWVHDADTVQKYGPEVMNAMWRGEIDPKAVKSLVPGFETGGPTDPNDPNYVGIATGQAPGGPAPGTAVTTTHAGSQALPGPPSVAPNPYQGGGINDIVGSIASGAQGPVNNLTQLISSLPASGQQQQDPGQMFLNNLLGGIIPGLNIGGQQQQSGPIPGLIGLAQAGGDPLMQQAWQSQTMNWLAGPFSSQLIGGATDIFGKVLGSFGLENSILSPSNPITSGILQGVGHFANLGQRMAAPQISTGAMSSMITLPDGRTVDLNTLLPSAGMPSAALPGGATTVPDWDAIAQGESGGNWSIPSDNQGQPYRGGLQILDSTWEGFGGTKYAPTANLATKAQQIEIAEKILAGQGPDAWPNTYTTKTVGGFQVTPAMLQQLYSGEGVSVGTANPNGPGNSGLQINTLRGKSVIQQMFPWATDIGGYSVRPPGTPQWHTKGLALDVMIPGAGGLNDPTPPQGKVLGDQLFGYLNAHKAELGIDYILWQEKDHYNHLHVNFAESGYPAATHDVGGRVPPGISQVVNRTGGDEYILNRPQASAAAHALQAQKILPTPPKPNFQVPDAQPKIPQPAFLKPLPQPIEQQAPPPPPPPVATPAPAIQMGPTTGTANEDVPQGSATHTLPWVDQAIESGASVAANIASSAIGAAGMGMPGAGALGQFAAGAIMQGGKIVQGIANVVSSSLVGSVPGSFMTTPEAYGRTLRPEQRELATASPRGGATYGPFYGHDTRSVMQEINLHESIEQQSALAAHPGRI